MCLCVFEGEEGEHRKSEENNRFKVKRLWFPFLCLQIPIPPSISASLWMLRLSLWDVIQLEQGIWPPEHPAESSPHAQWFCALYLSNINIYARKRSQVLPQVRVSPEGRAFVCCHLHKLTKHPHNPANLSLSLFLFLALSFIHAHTRNWLRSN